MTVPVWLLALLLVCGVAGLVAVALFVLFLAGLGALVRRTPLVLQPDEADDDGLLTYRRWP